ncbi:hypothetical protein Bca4012_082804 [Brassica carinata]
MRLKCTNSESRPYDWGRVSLPHSYYVAEYFSVEGKRRFYGSVKPPTQHDIRKYVPQR